jgi:hypothetical protein
MVLLKEREAREPKKFLKCHFFNTFFFTKLVNSATGYNYGAVRRWTSMKRLGYHLKDCDKVNLLCASSATTLCIKLLFEIIKHFFFILPSKRPCLFSDIYPYPYEHPLDFGCN